MSDNALFLIHKARTMAAGSINDFESVIKSLEKTDDRIANIYSKKGGKPAEFYMDWMLKENGNGVWLDAKEVKNELNLIDAINTKEYKKVALATNEQIQNLGLPQIPKHKADFEKSEACYSVDSLTYTIGVNLSDSIREALKEIDNEALEDIRIDELHRKEMNKNILKLKQLKKQ
jgi:hypothetical protein